MNLTVGDLLSDAKCFLRDNGLLDYSLDAELIFADLLKCSRENLIINSDDVICDANLAKEFRARLERRIEREPVSYIIKKRDFWKSSFFVNNAVLDPRACSEVLIEQILLLHKKKFVYLDILDLGVGSGCLLLSLLQEYRNARGVGVDRSQGACFVASTNAMILRLSNRVSILLNSWNGYQKKVGLYKKKFDLIISNPPYIKTCDLIHCEVSKHEPRLALNGGVNGINLYMQILSIAGTMLRHKGLLVMEIGINQYIELSRLALLHGFKICNTAKDLSGITRCVICKKM